MGLRFFVGKLVEHVYKDVELPHGSGSQVENWSNAEAGDAKGLDIVRKSLGHPINFCTSVRCVVASAHGMDAASSAERFLVASHLWAAGISVEYMPQSGVVMNLLKQQRETATNSLGVSELEVNMFCLCPVHQRC